MQVRVCFFSVPPYIQCGFANPTTKYSLDRQCLEISALFVHVVAVMRLTYNNVRTTPNMPRFSQGQLCIVTALARNDGNDQKLTVTLIPPGERNIDINQVPPEWKQFQIGRLSYKFRPSYFCF